MERLQKVVLLTVLIEKLREKGSWCGETHIQKATYFLQELLDVPTEFDFILYKHGPFSFDLRDELTAMRADGLLTLEPRQPNYGPSLVLTKRCKKLQQLFPKTLRKYEEELKFVADQLGNKGVTELEQLATALYVTSQRQQLACAEGKKTDFTTMETASYIHQLKPHVSVEDGKSALENLERIQSARGATNAKSDYMVWR